MCVWVQRFVRPFWILYLDRISQLWVSQFFPTCNSHAVQTKQKSCRKKTRRIHQAKIKLSGWIKVCWLIEVQSARNWLAHPSKIASEIKRNELQRRTTQEWMWRISIFKSFLVKGNAKTQINMVISKERISNAHHNEA